MYLGRKQQLMDDQFLSGINPDWKEYWSITITIYKEVITDWN